MMTDYEQGVEHVIINVNVEIIDKIAGIPLDGLSYRIFSGTIWRNQSVKLTLLHKMLHSTRRAPGNICVMMVEVKIAEIWQPRIL